MSYGRRGKGGRDRAREKDRRECTLTEFEHQELVGE